MTRGGPQRHEKKKKKIATNASISWARIAYRRYGETLLAGESGFRIPSGSRFSAPLQNDPNVQESAVLCIADTNRQPFHNVVILINFLHIINTFPVKLISTLSFHLHLCLPRCLLPLVFPNKSLHPILISPAPSTFPAHLVTLTMVSEQYQ